QLSATFGPLKQSCPDAVLVLGGNHVSQQGARLLPAHPDVDIVVNGEGEETFRALLRAYGSGTPLAEVAGISFREGEAVRHNDARPRSRSMLEFPSPYALGDVDYHRYDVALLETNRGCPYRCAFCYWGGRTGQKLAKGALDRVRDELRKIGEAGIKTLFVCDANFGIMQGDEEIARMIVETHAQYGAPSEVNVNWAKNHAKRVETIIRTLDAGGVRTEINVPLQTLSQSALRMAGRDETGRADMIDLAKRLVHEGRSLYCELIYGMPGESLADFARNYDRLYLEFPVLRIHPLWLLPNTDYHARRVELGIRTISPDPVSDYEAVIAHCAMDMAEMRDGLAMLLSHSILSLLGSARSTLRLLARRDGRSPAEELVAFERFVADRDEPLAQGLSALFSRIRRACYFERSLRDRKRQLLYQSRAATFELLWAFFRSRLPEPAHEDARAMLRYDTALLPRKDLPGDGHAREEHSYDFDPVELDRRLLVPGDGWREVLRDRTPVRVVLEHRAGLAKLDGRNCDLTGSWNGRVIRHEPAFSACVVESRAS
ncbi:MAG TPA: radical SAM protein, partial [Nannocystaceae bacterium]|nr:radical SAM protein [Nannocystaceae bacterium]